MPFKSTIGTASSRGFGEFGRPAIIPPPPYLILQQAGGGLDTLYKADNLTSLTNITNLGSGGVGYSRNKRIGMVFARGNFIFSGRGISTDGGISFFSTSLGSGALQSDPTAGNVFTSGLNGSFAYNSAANTLGVAFTTKLDAKSQTTNVGLSVYSATTGDFLGNSVSSGGFQNIFDGVRQVIYSPALSRFYVFSSNGQYHAFNDAGNYVQFGGIGAAYPFTIDPNGFPLAFNGGSLYRYTSQDLSTFTNLGAASIVGASNRAGFTYLPINQKYGVMSFSSSTFFFSLSTVSNPTVFTTTSSSIGSSNLFLTGTTMFEDSNGWIYVSAVYRYTVGKDSNVVGVVSYRSTDGGASFNQFGSSYIGYAKNLL